MDKYRSLRQHHCDPGLQIRSSRNSGRQKRRYQPRHQLSSALRLWENPAPFIKSRPTLIMRVTNWLTLLPKKPEKSSLHLSHISFRSAPFTARLPGRVFRNVRNSMKCHCQTCKMTSVCNFKNLL
ncbi:hypothetical protein TNCV_2503671 [Trichonephila clavipes]|nr:hypothetical protein TNCV_2503671 [Trichonephila clavipes]